VSSDQLPGRWRVERVSGALPPGGLRKCIGPTRGWTKLGPFPVAPFRVRGRTLDYPGLPLRDELAPAQNGQWVGRGLFLGREFCRFRLIREHE
jgi:hypothetical protein